MSQNVTLSTRKEAVAIALATGQTVSDAAAAAGATKRTVHRWLKESAFRDRVHELQSDLFGQAAGRLTALSAQAADALGALLSSEDEGVRLQAARLILDLGIRLREHFVLARDLDELRQRMEGTTDAGDDATTGVEPAEAAGSDQATGSEPDAGRDQDRPGERPGDGGVFS
jgi:transposase-like protein